MALRLLLQHFFKKRKNSYDAAARCDEKKMPFITSAVCFHGKSSGRRKLTGLPAADDCLEISPLGMRLTVTDRYSSIPGVEEKEYDRRSSPS